MEALMGIIVAVGAVVLFWHGYQLFQLFQIYVDRFNHVGEYDMEKSAASLIGFSQAYHNYSADMDELIHNTQDPFLKNALETVLNGSLRGHDLLKGLRLKAQTQYQEDVGKAYVIKKLQNFLPLIAWMVGIYSVLEVFTHVGESTLGLSTVWGVSLTLWAVFYGVVMSYFVVNPTFNYLMNQAKKNRQKNLMIIEGLGLVMKRKTPYEILESLNLAMPNPHMVDWRDVFAQEAEKMAA
jgi:flagellar motor component MotA